MHLAGCIFFLLMAIGYWQLAIGYWLSLCGFAATHAFTLYTLRFTLVAIATMPLTFNLSPPRLIASRLSPPFREGLGVGSLPLLMMIRLAAEDGHGAIDLLDEE